MSADVTTQVLPRVAARRSPLAAGAAVVTALVATLVLWAPDSGDQAFFRLVADELLQGRVLYRDIWDIKQPGIFVWYLLGDVLGIGDVGVRVVEIAALLACIPLVRAVARHLRLPPTVVAISPLLVVVPYACRVGYSGVGQVDGVVTVFLIAEYLLALRAARGRGSWLLVGLVGSVVLLFKLLYLPLVLVVAAGPLLHRMRRPVRAAATVAAGLVAPLAALGVLFASLGLLPLVLVTWFVLPPQVSALPHFRYAGGGLDELLAIGLLCSLTAVLAAPTLRAMAPRRLRVSLEREVTLLAWTALAVAQAFVQYPTSYRALMLAAPVGLLAAVGLAAWGPLVRASRGRRIAAAAVALVLAAPLAVFPAGLVPAVVAGRFSLSDAGLTAIAGRIASRPGEIDAIVRSRPAEVPLGPTAFFIADPGLYRALGVEQGIEMNGWSPEEMTAQMWTETAREIDRSRPRIVFVDTTEAEFVPADFTDRLRSLYVPVPVPRGTWWVGTGPAGPPPPTADGNRLVDLFLRPAS